MNGFERIAAALRGERPDSTPVMLHNFMMAAREAGVTMTQYRRSPEAIAATFRRAVETYGYDGIVVDVDTATLAGAVGVPVDFPEDAPASCHRGRLETLEAAADLPAPDVGRYEGVQAWLEAVTLLRRHFGDEVYIRGNCDQDPFSLAAMMRSTSEFMMDIMDPAREEAAHRLIEYSTLATTQFVGLMAGRGAHMVSNGDSTAGPDMMSPALYRRFALPYERRVAEYAHGLGLPYVLHICGKTDRILEDMAASGADGLELDYKTDVRLARDTLAGRGVVFLGNIDPNAVLALGTPELVAEKTRELMGVFEGNARFILNAGCAIPASTPAENLRALMRAAREV